MKRKKRNSIAIKLLILPTLFLIWMLMTLDASFLFYILGQLAGAIFLTQAFILQHEFGHQSFFKTRKLNTFLGYFISIFTFIPFYNWCRIHELHHTWTGWRDKDPTTERTFSEGLSSFQTSIVNFCWKYYIPLFTLGYRFGIYWKKEKLRRFLTKKEYQIAKINIYLYITIYILFMLWNFSFIIKCIPAVYLSWVVTDLLTLSQHAHIKMLHSENKEVLPLPFAMQAKYSRSIELPPLMAEYIFFNINMHESHHAYPGLPCYFLPKVQINSENNYPFIPWLRKVKSMEGVLFIFNSSAQRDGF